MPQSLSGVFWIIKKVCESQTLDSKWKFEQKLDYIHNNPLNEKWNLSKTPETYSWSSACFYESGIDQFGCLNHYQEFFG
jgi:putative transposase